MRAEVVLDRLVHGVAGHAQRLAVHDVAERDRRRLGGAAADVDDQAAARLGDRQTGTECRSERLFDEVDAVRARRQRFASQALHLDGRGPVRHADHDVRALDPASLGRDLDEVAQDLASGLEVRDHAVA